MQVRYISFVYYSFRKRGRIWFWSWLKLPLFLSILSPTSSTTFPPKTPPRTTHHIFPKAFRNSFPFCLCSLAEEGEMPIRRPKLSSSSFLSPTFLRQGPEQPDGCQFWENGGEGEGGRLSIEEANCLHHRWNLVERKKKSPFYSNKKKESILVVYEAVLLQEGKKSMILGEKRGEWAKGIKPFVLMRSM